MITGTTLRGVFPAIITPFTDDDKVDLKGLERIADYLIQNGIHAIMATGGTGEFCHLLREEKRDVIAALSSCSAGRVPIIAGTSACSTREAVILSQDAEAAGAAAVIATPPYYFKLPEQAIIDHYKQIAREISIPLVVYNNPLYTGNELSPDAIVHLMSVNNIIGLKQSNSDMGQLVDILRLAPAGRSICTGIDSQFYPALSVGAVGIYSTAAAVIPAQMVELYNLFQEGKHEEARDLHMQLQRLNTYFEYDPGYVAPCKEALRLLGLPAGPVRAPLPELSDSEKTLIRVALEDLGLL